MAGEAQISTTLHNVDYRLTSNLARSSSFSAQIPDMYGVETCVSTIQIPVQ